MIPSRTPPAARRVRLLGVLAGLLGLVVAGLVAWRSILGPPAPHLEPGASPELAATAGAGSFPVPQTQVSGMVPGVADATAADASRLLLQELRRGLGPLPGPEAARRLLAEAARGLEIAPRAEAIAALRALLDDGADVRTGLSFVVGRGGRLAESPTLRVWMLDQLGGLDAAAAAAYAPAIYARAASADEWAVALRNEWTGSPAADRIGSVRTGALSLLGRVDWAADPGPGYLEAFDFIVATLAWEAVPALERLLAPEGRADLRQAAALALDRLTLACTGDFLAELARRSDWLDTQPGLRAGLFARADLSAGRERAPVEAYLLRPGLDGAEARRYFEVVPNVGANLSHNLATPPAIVSPARAARLDAAALAAVEQWRTRPEFDRWRSELDVAAVRLSANVASARRGGLLSP